MRQGLDKMGELDIRLYVISALLDGLIGQEPLLASFGEALLDPVPDRCRHPIS